MAKRFLDAQLSLANNGTVVGTGTVPATPINTLGLDLSGAGSNAQVHFEGTVGLTIPAAGATIEITVVRDGSVVVYDVVQSYTASAGAVQTLSYNGADYLPSAAFHIYEVFITSTAAATVLSGPISFTAAGYSN